MYLDALQEVAIDPRDGYKFIVAIVSDGNGNARKVVRANQDCVLHHEIYALLRQEVKSLDPNARCSCIGGGRIEIDLDVRTIKLWADSGEFGKEPDRQETVRILSGAFPEFQVTGT